MEKVVMKTCTNCKTDKQVSEFYNESRSHCKDCERTAARKRMQREDNRLRTAYRDSKRQAEKHGVYDDLTLDDVMYTFAIASGRCAYCGEYAGEKLELEHIIPMSRGGANSLFNVTTSCGECNKRKSNESLFTHIQTNRFEVELMNSLINRMAFRKGVHRLEIADILHNHQQEVSKVTAKKAYERIKRK